MARKRKVEVGAFNIAVHPHDLNTYSDLLLDVHKLRRAVKVRGDDHVIMRLPSLRDSEDGKSYVGVLAKFTKIDPGQPWFNLNELNVAAINDLQNVQIPSAIQPNYAPFYFAFFPSHHLFVYETYYHGHGLSPRMLERYLAETFQSSEMLKKYKTVQVSSVASRDAIDYAFSLKTIKRLSISVYRPNADDLVSAEEKFDKRLGRLNAKSLSTTIEAASGKSLNLEQDTEINELSLLAVKNEELITAGLNERGVREVRSTKQHPQREAELFDPDLMSELQAFRMAASRFISKTSLLNET